MNHRYFPFFVLWLNVLVTISSAQDSEDNISVAWTETEITDSDREHWAFRPLQVPELAAADCRVGMAGPIDGFVHKELAPQDLIAAPSANRRILARRLSLDVLGLPPNIDDVERFANDSHPDAYERYVDRLLGSTAYGEHWAQYWLDLARFAETDGFEHDKVREQAWLYRQWVIDALNDDMPYDQFLRLQIAGDEIGGQSCSIPTMFCLAGPDMPDINEQDLRRHDRLNEIVSAVGAAVLGMQLHCAQCHDHKYDPLSLGDFYRMRSYFDAGLPVLQRDKHVNELIPQPSAITSEVYFRGELANRGPHVTAAPPRVLCSENWSSAQVGDAAAGSRLALADWMTSPDNPIVARVFANRLWQFHFGRSITGNPSDFGLIAGEPTHPELLDWLACELQRGNWSIKHMHRQILLSSTFRQQSYPEEASAVSDKSYLSWKHRLSQDPDNRWLGRFSRRRLRGEVIRDRLLFVSGQLDREMGGPSVRPALPKELLSTLLKGQWEPSLNPGDQVRRSVYIFARRNLRYPIFDVFDRPDAGASCSLRESSTTAIQSLQMLNSDLTLSAAKAVCHRIPSQADWKVQEFVEKLFPIILCRPARADEIQWLIDSYANFSLSNDLASDAEAQWQWQIATALALLNSNEFLYLD
ncbi:MAG: DUF1553 domain-containing protein [Planctomycetales bacterium]|nr:DUF1553 domain-containing protein [Planctomycetales bacterium]